MNATQLIQAKQIEWAKNKGIKLVGSAGDRGKRVYTEALNENLYQALDPGVEAQLREGDGGELTASSGGPAKMHALHSSSALAINVFHYWLTAGNAVQLASACGFCADANRHVGNLEFEAKFPALKNVSKHPNIDVVFRNSDESAHAVYAIESKFAEPYGNWEKKGVQQAYFDDDEIWRELPALRKFAQTIIDIDTHEHLHAAQLVKHVLGLTADLKDKKRFRLLYLWYDVPGTEGCAHRAEVETFKKVAEADGVAFLSLTYQELIAKLAERYRDEHKDYIRYITSRYL